MYILFPFPFRFSPNSILTDVEGAWANPREENVPGSCVNWWTIRNGVLMSSLRGSLLFNSVGCAADDIRYAVSRPAKKRNVLQCLALVSWAMNNYWFINSPTIKGGEYLFRYRLKFWRIQRASKKPKRFAKAIRWLRIRKL